MRRLWLWGLGGLLLLALASIAWIGLVSGDPEGWHVDPMAAPAAGPPGSWRLAPAGVAVAGDAVAPVYRVPAGELARALDAVALAEPVVARLAGRPEELWTTYVSRPGAPRLPLYLSVRAVELEEGRSTLAILGRSRTRWGAGATAALVERWLVALAPLEV